MRELKFRAWVEKEHEIYNGKDEYIYDWQDTVYIDSLQFHPEGIVVEQFTGLQDKNGEDIYEGDIVKYADGVEHWDDSYSGLEIVKFTNGSFYPFCGCGGEYSMYLEEAEIVGNKHENPELIK